MPVRLEDEVLARVVERRMDQEASLGSLVSLRRRALRLGRDRELVRLAERLLRAVRKGLPALAVAVGARRQEVPPARGEPEVDTPDELVADSNAALRAEVLDVERLGRAEEALAVRALEVEGEVERVLDRIELVGAERERRALQGRVAEVRARLRELDGRLVEQLRRRLGQLDADHRTALPSLAFCQIAAIFRFVAAFSSSRSFGSESVPAFAR